MRDHDANRFIRDLTAALRENPLRETTLLAPSYRVGRQWLDRAALLGGGVTNARATPLARLMLDFAQPRLAKAGARPGRIEEKTRLIGLALSNMAAANRDSGYFTRLPVTLNLAQSVLATVEEMEDAGAGLSRGLAGKLVSREKGDELALLLARYRLAKKNAGLIGHAEIADAATRALRDARERNPACIPLLLVPESIPDNATNRERAFLSAWPEDRFRVIPEDDAGRPDDMLFFRADSAANEAREILRRIREAGVPLDCVEVVCVDPAAFVPVLCAAGLEWFGGKTEDLPFTFIAGLPGNHARPARLLAAWLAWLRNDLPPAGLADMLQTGLFAEGWRDAAPGVDAAALAARLKALPLQGGSDGYRMFLGRGAEGPVRDAERWLARRLGAILPPDGGAGGPDLDNARSVLRAAAALLGDQQAHEGKLDAYARVALLESIDAWGIAADWPEFDAVAWLGDLARGLTVMGLGPMPGRLHVSDVRGGGHSGRSLTFLAGLDDSRFPGGARQDPILLDRERLKISRRLAASPARRENREKAMGRLLSRLGGTVVVSHAGHDAAAGRELRPAALFRKLAGDREVAGASLRPAAPDACLTRRDVWLREVLERPGASPVLVPGDLAPWRPNLASGDAARRERLSDRFTEWDGRVPEAGDDFSREEWVLSPSQLEMFARCPMDFFFRKVLGVKPPDRYAPLPGQWLRGNERGELLHGLFQNFMMELEDAGERVTPESHERLGLKLMNMLENALRRRRESNPPRDGTDACVIFLYGEIARSEQGRPLSWEAALGGAAGDAPPWNRVDPIRLDAPPGRSVLLQGRVDRIDRLHDNGGLVIRDYKTGRSSDFSRTDPFRQGRHLQPLLYTEMLEQATREAGLPEPVREFSYLFPMRRDEGAVIAFDRDDLRGGMAIVGRLLDMLSAGCFPFTTREEDAAHSDYLPAYGCAEGGVRELCAAARRKAACDGALRAWSELRLA